MQCSPMHTRLVLIRHGHTASNGGSARAVMSGWTDLPLTPLGMMQATALRAAWSRRGLEAIYSSPLRRARDTVRPMAEAKLAQVCHLDGLREIDCGDADGMLIGEVRRVYADAWARNAAESDDDFRWPRGESYTELRDRVLSTVTGLARKHRGQRVAVVTTRG